MVLSVKGLGMSESSKRLLYVVLVSRLLNLQRNINAAHSVSARLLLSSFSVRTTTDVFPKA